MLLPAAPSHRGSRRETMCLEGGAKITARPPQIGWRVAAPVGVTYRVRTGANSLFDTFLATSSQNVKLIV